MQVKRHQAGKSRKAPFPRDPVVEFYMRDVDRTLLRENLKLTPAQRLEKALRFAAFVSTLRDAGARARGRSK